MRRAEDLSSCAQDGYGNFMENVLYLFTFNYNLSFMAFARRAERRENIWDSMEERCKKYLRCC